VGADTPDAEKINGNGFILRGTGTFCYIAKFAVVKNLPVFLMSVVK
jgi:hypothetical protein